MVNGISTLSYSLEMDWVLLWLTAKVLGHRTTTLRITLAATIGVLPTLWVLLRQNLYAVPWELGLVWPIVMLPIALRGLRKRFWLKGYLLFLSMTLLAGGLVDAGLGWFRLWAAGLPALDWVFVVPALLIAAGVWVPKRRVRQLIGRESYGEITLELEGRSLRLSVLWDSGNELTDSLTHRPVVIVELSRAFEWIPEDLLPWVLGTQESPGAVPERWQGRAGVVAFRTLAGQGTLPVVTVDQASGNYADRWYSMVPLVVGFSREPVASDGSYDALATPKSLIHYPHERVGA